jgi:hypothetical protein
LQFLQRTDTAEIAVPATLADRSSITCMFQPDFAEYPNTHFGTSSALTM